MKFALLTLWGCLLADAGPRFEAVTADGATIIAGELQSLQADGSAQVGGKTIRSGELIELRQSGAIRPLPPLDRPLLLLSNGDHWPGHVLSIQDDQMAFVAEMSRPQELRLPVSQLATVWLTRPHPAAEQRLMDFEPSKRLPTDEAHLINGDVVRGAVVSMNQSELAMEAGGAAKKLPRERVAGIVFSSDPPRPGAAKGPIAKVVLANGARFSVTEARLQDGRLVGQVGGGNEVRILIADVVHLAVVGGRALYLSELAPIKYDFTPFFGIHWPLAINRNSAGGWMQIGPQAFDRGLGMHSQSLVRYAIPARSTRFEAWLGLDRRVGARGRAVAAVRIDGGNAFGPVEIAATDAPRWVTLDLPASSRELMLAVEFGPAADVQDHVNWADARFVRADTKR